MRLRSSASSLADAEQSSSSGLCHLTWELQLPHNSPLFQHAEGGRGGVAAGVDLGHEVTMQRGAVTSNLELSQGLLVGNDSHRECLVGLKWGIVFNTDSRPPPPPLPGRL